MQISFLLRKWCQVKWGASEKPFFLLTRARQRHLASITAWFFGKILHLSPLLRQLEQTIGYRKGHGKVPKFASQCSVQNRFYWVRWLLLFFFHSLSILHWSWHVAQHSLLLFFSSIIFCLKYFCVLLDLSNVHTPYISYHEQSSPWKKGCSILPLISQHSSFVAVNKLKKHTATLYCNGDGWTNLAKGSHLGL